MRCLSCSFMLQCTLYIIVLNIERYYTIYSGDQAILC